MSVQETMVGEEGVCDNECLIGVVWPGRQAGDVRNCSTTYTAQPHFWLGKLVATENARRHTTLGLLPLPTLTALTPLRSSIHELETRRRS